MKHTGDIVWRIVVFEQHAIVQFNPAGIGWSSCVRSCHGNEGDFAVYPVSELEKAKKVLEGKAYRIVHAPSTWHVVERKGAWYAQKDGDVVLETGYSSFNAALRWTARDVVEAALAQAS